MILFWSNESNFFHYQGLGKGRINISKLKDGKFWLVARLIPRDQDKSMSFTHIWH